MAWRTPDGSLPIHAVYGRGVTHNGNQLYVTRWRGPKGEISLEPTETLQGRTIASTKQHFNPDGAHTWARRHEFWSQERVDKYLSVVRPPHMPAAAPSISLHDQLNTRAEAGRLMAADGALTYFEAMRAAMRSK